MTKRQVWAKRKQKRHLKTKEKSRDDVVFVYPTTPTAQVDVTTTSMTEYSDSDDLGIRFSKVEFYADSYLPEGFLPLTADEYPVTDDVKEILSQSKAVSLVLPDDYECAGADTEKILDAIGGFPSHPSSDPNDPYWDQLRTVVEVQHLRRNGASTESVMPLPDIWEGYNLDQVAEAVHDEFPGIYHVELLKAIIKAGLQVDYDVIPKRCNTTFLRGPVMLAHLNTWSVGVVGPINFAMKWLVGLARPEEIAWMISQGDISEEDGVPSDIVAQVNNLDLESQFDFTAYEEGSPMHPSWPAMHSAASSCSLWLAVVLNLTPKQICQARLVDFAIAYARTVAGVHYPWDNIAGLSLGQEYVATELVNHLVEKYGSNRTQVEEKVARMRFSWGEFDPWSCVSD